MNFHSLEGRILVASPHIGDNYFEQSLVYVCAHDESGALGVIINQRIGQIDAFELKNYVADIHKIFNQDGAPQKKMSAKKSMKNYPVLFGGPAYSDKVVVLSLTKEQEKNFTVEQNLTLYTDMVLFLKEYTAGKNHSKLLFAKGIAAWEPLQLEAEVRDSHWFVIPASIDLLFSQRIKSKWDTVIKGFGIMQYQNLVGYSGLA